jgi:S1-C subfamily serine protease
VPAPPDVAQVELTLQRGARVSGTVVDRQSRTPLAGARISAEGAPDPEGTFPTVASSATSDANGQFQLGGLSPGLHSLEVAAEGHNPRILSGLVLPPDGELGPLAIDLARTAPGEEPKLEFVGIGVVIKAEGDVMQIVNVVPGGGGAEVGLQPGDAILSIDGVAAAELGFAGSIEKIRGPEGTTVQLVVRRKDGSTVPMAVPRRALRT